MSPRPAPNSSSRRALECFIPVAHGRKRARAVEPSYRDGKLVRGDGYGSCWRAEASKASVPDNGLETGAGDGAVAATIDETDTDARSSRARADTCFELRPGSRAGAEDAARVSAPGFCHSGACLLWLGDGLQLHLGHRHARTRQRERLSDSPGHLRHRRTGRDDRLHAFRLSEAAPACANASHQLAWTLPGGGGRRRSGQRSEALDLARADRLAAVGAGQAGSGALDSRPARLSSPAAESGRA